MARNNFRRGRHRRRHDKRKLCGGGAANWRTRYKKAIDECRLLNSTLFASCHGAVRVNRYYRSCIMDSCACPPSGRCFCESYLAYSRRCEKENILIDWRSHAMCESEPSPCNVQGSVFSPCSPTCTLTCSMVSKNMTCAETHRYASDSCTPGCHCPHGTALLLNQCIPVALCPSPSSIN